MRSDIIISVDELLNTFKSPNLKILEATFFLPNQGRNAAAEFTDKHISGAQFFDIDSVADTSVDLPHMLPSPEQFSVQMQELGINTESDIIVYDRSPFLSSARCWWMFRLFGHKKIRVLNGGFAAWIAANGAVETGNAANAKKGNFITSGAKGAGHIIFSELFDEINAKNAKQIIDARPSPRFTGDTPEPRPGLASGHMPGACNLPITQILHNDGTLKSNAELSRLFEDAGIDMSKPVITTCGSGVTAAGLTLALAMLGSEDVRLYDGSWAEWGSHPDAPIEKGHAN